MPRHPEPTEAFELAGHAADSGGGSRGSEMRFVGVDLAWGERALTGLCVLNAGGDVLGSGRRQSFLDIVEWVRPYAESGVVMGVDAPLVVENPSGRRSCEAQLGAAFGSREAGPYPSNRSMAAFQDGGRGRRLADVFGLSLSPTFSPRAHVRRILEVYPHSAMVSLFALSKTVKYKAKRGRSRDARAVAFSDVIGYIEGLDAAEPPLRVTGSKDWARLRSEIAAAPTSAALDRAEDELDAYLCAYVALYYWHWGLDRCVVFGDDTSGQIVTPVDLAPRCRLRAQAVTPPEVTGRGENTFTFP